MVRCTDARIRIRTKMSRILNTGYISMYVDERSLYVICSTCCVLQNYMRYQLCYCLMQVVALEQEKRALEQKVDRLDSTLGRLDSALSKFIQEQQQKEQVVLIVLASCLRMQCTCQGTTFSTFYSSQNA
jgi:hypothetical protein